MGDVTPTTGWGWWWLMWGGVAVVAPACASTAPAPKQRAVIAAERPTVARVKKKPAIRVTLPDLPADASCREARAAYVERWQMKAGGVAPDVSRGHLSSVLGSGNYVKACGVPESYEVHICAAIQNGRVRGATVTTEPWSTPLVRCLDKRVRKLSFPRSSRMDITKTVFRPSR